MPVFVSVFSGGEADELHRRRQLHPEHTSRRGGLEQPDGSVDAQVECRPRVVDEPALAAEGHVVRPARGDRVGLGVDEGWRLPVLEVEGIALLEEDGKLPALRTEPEPVFASQGVDVGLQLPRRDQLAVDPAVARGSEPTYGGGHHAALPGGDDGDASARSLAQHHHDRMLPEEGHVVVERGLRRASVDGQAMRAPRRRRGGAGLRASRAPHERDRPASSASTSRRSGIEACAPRRVTESAAAALANGTASSIERPSASATPSAPPKVLAGGRRVDGVHHETGEVPASGRVLEVGPLRAELQDHGARPATQQRLREFRRFRERDARPAPIEQDQRLALVGRQHGDAGEQSLGERPRRRGIEDHRHAGARLRARRRVRSSEAASRAAAAGSPRRRRDPGRRRPATAARSRPRPRRSRSGLPPRRRSVRRPRASPR